MRKLFYIFIVFQLFTSCFKDDSNLEVQKIKPIVIKEFGSNQLNITQFDTLKIEPLIYCEGVADKDLSFEWKLMNYGVIESRVIDTTMYCCAYIPDNASKDYTVRLKVTDRTTGIYAMKTYSLEVKSGFGPGMLVADTRDGGQTSDLTLLRCREVTYDYGMSREDRSVGRNLWSLINGAPFAGEVLDVRTVQRTSNPTYYGMTVVTTKGIYETNPGNYVQTGFGSDLFFFPPDFSVTDIASARLAVDLTGPVEQMLVNGKVTARSLPVATKYGATIYPAGVEDYHISQMAHPDQKAWAYPAYAYDELGKRMLFFAGNASGELSGYQAPEQYGGPFDVNDLSKYTPFFLGESKSGMDMLVKNNETGAYQVLSMNFAKNTAVTTTRNFARKIYNLQGAPKLEEAIAYEMNPLDDVIYYATEDEIYAGPMATPSLIQQRWRAAAGEKITAIQFFKYPCDQANSYYYRGGQHYLSDVDGGEKTQYSVHRLLFVATEDAAGNGKVTAIPLQSETSGRLEKNDKYHLIFEGFGHILGFYKQE